MPATITAVTIAAGLKENLAGVLRRRLDRSFRPTSRPYDYGAVVWVAVAFVDEKIAEVCSVPLSQAWIPWATVTIACVVFVGGITWIEWVVEQVVPAVVTSLNPTLK